MREEGWFQIWVYGREGNGWIVYLIDPIRRLTSRMPLELLNQLSFLLAVPLLVTARTLYQVPWLGSRLPYAAYIRWLASFSLQKIHAIVLDHALTPVAHYMSRGDVEDMVKGSGWIIDELEHNRAMSWGACTRREHRPDRNPRTSSSRMWRITSMSSRRASDGEPAPGTRIDAMGAPDPRPADGTRRLVPRHTFGPDIRAATGVNLWPRTIGDSEPLDCDEAAYAYMGHRAIRGDVLYRDLTEYKPPLGYWIYTTAIAIGGYTELAIRLMAIPFVLATIAAVWWIALRLGGPLAACVAAGLYVLLSTDPFLFGNGSNMEHFINLFATLSLAMLIRAWDRDDRRWIFAAGICLGAAALVKQVALAHAIVLLPALLARAWVRDGTRSRRACGASSTSWHSAWGCRPSWRSRRRSSRLAARGRPRTRTSSSRRGRWRPTRCPSRTPRLRRSAG